LRWWWASDDVSVDNRQFNTFGADCSDRNHRTIPSELRKELLVFMNAMSRSSAEINAISLQPFVLAYVQSIDEGKWSYLLEGTDPFKASNSWIKGCLRELNMSFQRVTNDRLKLVPDAEAELEKMRIRMAFLCAKHKIPPELVINIDETPLMLLPSTGYTWSEKGGDSAKGIKDKRQFTLTPAISAAGVLVAMQLIFKGKTAASEPSAEFKRQFFAERDRSFPGLLFDFNHTPNHWCSEETMQKLISLLEQHRLRVCEEKGLPRD
jgi:hypothetical protein